MFVVGIVLVIDDNSALSNPELTVFGLIGRDLKQHRWKGMLLLKISVLTILGNLWSCSSY